MEEARDHRDGTSAPTEDASSAPAAERRIGAYRLVRELGHGGMGTVFLASRADDQYHKRVAIKIIRGADSDEVVRHFRRERQILAALEHPNIARLLDGGTTDDGLPYFVMEHVEGQPIDTYCDERKLSIRERLKLFQGVCAAVQHAHRNLVVHRDIKPGNILVAAEGTPKLLDFGIAKLLNAGLGGGGDTGTAFAMTPAYASPEQVRGRPVTTATDVYALGVVLYELLSGHRPYGRGVEQPLDVMKAVCEEEPEKPSTAVGRTEESAAAGSSRRAATPESVSRTREGTPERLRRRLKGDLDNIVLKALRKEPQQRYPSAEALGEDLELYLSGRPVKARKPTTLYRSAKFVRRHLIGVVACVTIFLLAVGFGIAMGVQARRVARERDRAERLAGFMVDLFKVSDPSEARGNSITAREMLDRGAEKITGGLKGEPETRATLMATMGGVYGGLGLYEQARPLLEEALRIRRQLHGDESLEVATSVYELATLRHRLGDYPGAEREHRTALTLRMRLQGADAAGVVDSFIGLGNALLRQDKLDEGEAAYQEALAITRKVRGGDDAAITRCLNNLASIKLLKGDFAGAEKDFRELLTIRRRLYGAQDPRVASALSNLSSSLTRQGKLEEAQGPLREAISIYRLRLGDDHPELATALANLAFLYEDRGNLAEAEPLLREALRIKRKALGNDHPDLAWVLVGLASLLIEKKDFAAAEPLLREGLTIQQKALGSEHTEFAESLRAMADLLANTDRASEGEKKARESLRIRVKVLAADHPDIAESEGSLGLCLANQRRFEEAEPLMLHAFEVLTAKEPQRLRATKSRERLVALYEAWGKPDKAAQYRPPASK